MQSVTVPATSQLTGTVDNNHQHVSATAPNVTSATNKTINLVATDTSGNTATTSFNVTIKPLRDKYRVGTSSTAANPVKLPIFRIMQQYHKLIKRQLLIH